MVYVDNSLAFLVVILVIALGALFFYNENNKQTKTRVVNIPSSNTISNDPLMTNKTRGRTSEIKLPIFSSNGQLTLVYDSYDGLQNFPLVKDASGKIIRGTATMEGVLIIKTGGLRVSNPSFDTNIKIYQENNDVFSRVILMNSNGDVIATTGNYPGSDLQLILNNDATISIVSQGIKYNNVTFNDNQNKNEIKLPITSPNGYYTFSYINTDAFTGFAIYDASKNKKGWSSAGGTADATNWSPGAGSGYPIRGNKMALPPNFNTNFKLFQVISNSFSRIVIMNDDGIIVGGSAYYPTTSNFNLSVTNDGSLVLTTGNYKEINPPLI